MCVCGGGSIAEMGGTQAQGTVCVSGGGAIAEVGGTQAQGTVCVWGGDQLKIYRLLASLEASY